MQTRTRVCDREAPTEPHRDNTIRICGDSEINLTVQRPKALALPFLANNPQRRPAGDLLGEESMIGHVVLHLSLSNEREPGLVSVSVD